ncbi:MAG: nicotinamide-nucleotide adenylyltransferase [Candidatus Woesearchaeota archaeon]|jgi:nicotinamide-nucleotide adenylyltransferase|nr:nicotinamide-nucleotide adenylyltransferase [Candidatus Woesearchaeota archaeon]MDP7622930.1 nicotinamide-nucleotide adenylyltransferase [Candidatus Woesearchaeota archaeon]HJN57200.1 nicotinamide-nucleotide adenylyltransferase [Candidatus Woesearchaeota archaeon]|tara:strand:- start:21626 stop:22129 length:504 start_codon:yes stop_codon:yes gene_type:complete
MTRGLFIGRFQPFHLGHLNDIKNALKEVDELVIGVGSSDEKHTKDNPFTVKERIEMMDLVLPNNDIQNYTVFPIPDFHDDKRWVEHIETLVPEFDLVYTGNKWTEKCFKKKYKVKKVKIIKGISSTIIRHKMIKNQDWKAIVPKETADYIKKINGVRRVKRINSKSK